MRIACLQFNPSLGHVQRNIERADSILSASPSKLQNLDLLVLPELAFTGYNFRSLAAISPYLEPTSSGPSTKWALATAKRLNCAVSVGYPEITTPSTATATATAPPSPRTHSPHSDPSRRYNSTITVSPTGLILANYRKTFLYYTDETWASPGPSGFWSGSLLSQSPPPFAQPSLSPSPSPSPSPLSQAALAICMDLNPQAFTAPWTKYELATHILHTHSKMAILSMAWLTRLSSTALTSRPKEPDMETFSYWLARLQPVVDVRGQGEVVVVFANRCGVEEEEEEEVGAKGGVEGAKDGATGEVMRGDGEAQARYAGTSAVVGVGGGRVRVWGVLGRGEEGVLSVDTGTEPGLETWRNGNGQIQVSDLASIQSPSTNPTKHPPARHSPAQLKHPYPHQGTQQQQVAYLIIIKHPSPFPLPHAINTSIFKPSTSKLHQIKSEKQETPPVSLGEK
ncbi:MAG: Carbon-nitrogen hydrolase [Pleopsidium flavum]|nr:MAG: Carbon-nitrogen hydrolase [Pleopsidium flavum]